MGPSINQKLRNNHNLNFASANPSFLYGLSPQQLSAATLSAFGRFLGVSFSCLSLSVFFKSSQTLPLEFFIRVHIVFDYKHRLRATNKRKSTSSGWKHSLSTRLTWTSFSDPFEKLDRSKEKNSSLFWRNNLNNYDNYETTLTMF